MTATTPADDTPPPEGRILKDWIKSYLKYTHDSESPDSFHMWTGFWTLAGALQRKVYIPFGHGFIFANLYVVLCAPPGRVKKTHAMKIGAKLLSKCDIDLVPSSTTREALIKRAEAAEEVFYYPDGSFEIHNSLSMAADEMAAFMGEHNFPMITLLTDWFDCANNWVYETKGAGTNTINALWFNMIAATTSGSLASFLPQHAFGGGFTARIVFVVENEPRKKIAIPSSPEDNPAMIKLGNALIHDLKYIKNHLRGRFTWSPEAREYYTKWYNSDDRNKGIADEKMLVYLDRKPIHAIKLAMVRHVSRSNSLIIELRDILEAIACLDALEPRMPEAFSGVGANKFGGVQTRIFQHIARIKDGISNEELLAVFWQDLSSKELDGVLTTLRDMGSIRVTNVNGVEYYHRVSKADKAGEEAKVG